ncbi:hypothetical protein CDCA_CDCA08G2469 [Cyanidium caldarium]|uniref:Reticulon-like protein n=1 Tax=Cyanidium caldarium TaxID=2771 RepID=A0AAV9IVY3_CYACA|nr:hypothetical protein CDCA_CDCA08G2469 [Cyanidium caldarium]
MTSNGSSGEPLSGGGLGSEAERVASTWAGGATASGGDASATPASQSLRVAPRKIPGQLQEILMWRNKYRSGLVFSLGNLFFFFTTVMQLTTVTVFAMIVFWLVLIGACLVQLSKALAYVTNSAPLVAAPDREHRRFITRDWMVRHIDTLVNAVNILADRVRDAVYCRDWRLTAKVLLGSYVIGKLGSLLVSMWVGWLLFLSVMTLPKLYEWKQKEIDQMVDDIKPVVTQKVRQAESFARQKAQELADRIPPKAKERLRKLQSMARSATGGGGGGAAAAAAAKPSSAAPSAPGTSDSNSGARTEDLLGISADTASAPLSSDKKSD